MSNTITELIFIPLPVIGHMRSTIELTNLLINRNHHLSITVLIIQPISGLQTASPIATYIHSLTNTAHIRFIILPQHKPLPKRHPKSPMTFVNDYITTHFKHVRNIVTEITSQQNSGKLSAFVIDMLCTSMIDVANEFNVPTYVFYTSSAAYLGYQLYIQRLVDDLNHDVERVVELANSDCEINVPVFVHPVPTKVFPSGYDTKEGLDYVMLITRKLRSAKAVIVNTFLELEQHAIVSLSSDSTVPSVYPVGPILNPITNSVITNSVDSVNSGDDDVIRWLDNQPNSSVVFLCFGSLGKFDEVQLKEIATALERSSYRFLWSINDQEAVLPEGFVERTRGRGKVIGWALQMAVLGHGAVGGFVTHCGWNSVLESLWFGVPVATWPIYAEQQMNAFEIVVELELGVEIKLDYRKDLVDVKKSVGVVSCEEIENGIRRLMEDDEMRRKMKEMSMVSRVTVGDGGSSYDFVGRLVQDFVRNVS
ncbi:hypothetical protein QVD17_28127 [Tagetes erecta]|uniref:Glycosyltransferase n=1 Tax=Tagetes erecta TaxID=13708 RepID=A0AAD8KC94_TARER|nr:hypothetical protein QVD17_28127 [Tagetes erecta]